MIRATTPLIRATIEGVDLTRADSVYMTIRQFGREITLTGDDLDVTAIVEDGETTTQILFRLNQSASLGLAEGRAEIQANWIYTDDGVQLRGATLFKTFVIDKQILARVLP